MWSVAFRSLIAVTTLATERCAQAFVVHGPKTTPLSSTHLRNGLLLYCSYNSVDPRSSAGSRCRGQRADFALSSISIAQQSLPGGERSPAGQRQFISILSEDGTEQMLPTASASRFPLSVVEGGKAGRKQVVAVPGESSEEGWVNPRSYGELWIPAGSPAPKMTLCLGMLTKDGQPRYVMPLVDLVVDKGGRRWRNRGLRSLPSAHCWEPVARAASGALSVSAFTEEKVKGSETDSIWGPLVEDVDVSEAFAELVGVVADPPPGLDLGTGFQFLATKIKGGGPFSVPACGGRVRMFLSDLPEPARLLEVDDVRGVAELSFDVVAVASGGESEFLPEVYRGLFE